MRQKHNFRGTGKIWKLGSGQMRIPLGPLRFPSRQDSRIPSGHRAGDELRTGADADPGSSSFPPSEGPQASGPGSRLLAGR